jgi:hypothetical protein
VLLGKRINGSVLLLVAVLILSCGGHRSVRDGAPIREGKVVEGELRNAAPGSGDYHYGFRIQIYATRDLEKARNVAESARQLFNEKTYIEYQEPLYKVRIGDYPTREQAERMLYKVTSSGFEDAWLVETTIRVGDAEGEGEAN